MVPGLMTVLLAEHHGATVIAGLRPEDLADPGTAASTGGTSPEPGTSLTVNVQLVEVLGREQLVHFHVDARRVREEGELRGQLGGAQDPAGGGGRVAQVQSESEIVAAAVASGVARVDPRAAIRPHAPAVLQVNGERLQFFDPATGAAIS